MQKGFFEKRKQEQQFTKTLTISPSKYDKGEKANPYPSYRGQMFARDEPNAMDLVRSSNTNIFYIR